MKILLCKFILSVRTLLLALIALICQIHNLQSEELTVGSGDFIFVDPAGNPKKPIQVFYYCPPNFSQDSSVVFVMHGVSRNAAGYRDVWSKYADAKRLLILAPEFSQEHYSSSRQYNLGYLYDTDGKLRNKARWSFTAIERIFDQVVQANGLTVKQYSIYGHSAGGQFVHRFVLFMPDARYKVAIAANPGWYTMPSFGLAYPYGLGGTEVSPTHLSKAFQRRFVLLLGKEDTSTNDENLRNTPEAMLQGPHRLARGKEYIKQSRMIAKESDVKIKWLMQVVPNAGHSNSKMSAAAAKMVR
jgi:pimeloyl-ACP methyl ester carboxylesterase